MSQIINFMPIAPQEQGETRELVLVGLAALKVRRNPLQAGVA